MAKGQPRNAMNVGFKTIPAKTCHSASDNISDNLSLLNNCRNLPSVQTEILLQDHVAVPQQRSSPPRSNDLRGNLCELEYSFR